MSFIGCRASADDVVDDRTLPWDPLWAYVLDEGDEQSLQRQSKIVKRETPDEHVIFSEPPELTRRPSFWHRREELLLQTKNLDEIDADAGHTGDLPPEEAHEDHDVEERWTWELDRDVFSFGSSNNETARKEIVLLDDAEEDAEIQVQEAVEADSVRRWRSRRCLNDSHHGHKKNLGVPKRNSHGRKLTPVAAVDEERDVREGAKASTWHFELDRDALGF